MAGEDENNDENANIPPPVPPTQQAPHTLSTIKLPILKKGEYDIWAMKMEHYLGHTDYPIWEVIQKENGPVQVSTDTNGQIRVLPPKTAEEILARERERNAKTTLLMSIPEDHLAKFHKMTDAKEMWEAINPDLGLHKGYDRFQSLLSQLEIHGAGVSTEDANQKFLRSLPSSWSQVSLIMRTKPVVDALSFDDLYNNLRVFELDVKGSTASSSSIQYVAFVSYESTSSTNEDSTAYGVSTSSGHNSQREGSSSYTDELMYSFFANQSSGPQLDHEDLEQIDEFDLEEMDLKWQGTLLESADQNEIKKAEEEMQGTLDTKQKTIGGDLQNKMNLKLCNSGLDTEVTSCSKECEESYAKLKKLYDEQREQLGDASIEIQACTLALKRSSDVEDSLVYDRFAKVEGMHAVTPPMIGIYMPPKSDFGIDESQFTYGPKQTKSSESDAKTSDFASCKFNSCEETLESVPKPVVNEPKSVSEPNVWSDAPIIEEYESDSDDEFVIKPSKEQEKPSFAFVNTVKHVKTPRETVKEQDTYSQNPKVDKRDWTDYDFHEKRMAKQVELNKQKGKVTGQRENRLVWNNVQRLNQKNKFVPKAVLTKTGIFPVNNARQNFSSQAATSIARKVNTATHLLLGEIGKLLLRPQQVVIGDQKDIIGTKSPNTIVDQTLDDPQKALKNKGIIDSECSRHMTGNRAYLVEYQDYNGGPVAFGGSKELKQFNLFSVSQMCDKKNKVLFTDSECLMLSPDFKLPDENQVLLRVPRKNNMYSFNLENIVSTGGKGPNWLFDLDYLTDSMNYQPVTAENKANKTAGPKEANHCVVKSSEAKNGDEKPNEDTEKEANDAAEAFRKEFAQSTEDLLLQAGATRATSTNTVNTVSTPISTASPSRIFSTCGPDLTNNDQDDSQIPALEDIYDNPSDGIFTNASIKEEKKN
ncbi:hypothetical protein Tco_0266592 [Tanacetum coccineum]